MDIEICITNKNQNNEQINNVFNTKMIKMVKSFFRYQFLEKNILNIKKIVIVFIFREDILIRKYTIR